MNVPDDDRCRMTTTSSLYEILASINEERNKGDYHHYQYDESTERRRSRDSTSVYPVPYDPFWGDLLRHHFLSDTTTEDSGKDDMIFFVTSVSSHRERPRVDVFRRGSSMLPALGYPGYNWEESVYLNLIMQQFEYCLTVAICTRTSSNEMEILQKKTLRVYASPSRRSLDSKGTSEEITYPNIFFIVDNFEEVYDLRINTSEVVCVELVAVDRNGNSHSVLFLGSVRYDLLHSVYESKKSLSRRAMQSFGFSKQRFEFVRMKGPRGKGYAELAVTYKEPPALRVAGSTSSINMMFSGLRSSFSSADAALKKSRSENDNQDGWVEISSTDLRQPDEQNNYEQQPNWGSSWGGWLGRGKPTPPPPLPVAPSQPELRSYLTYVALPWHNIIADVLETRRRQPVLTF